MSQTSYPTQFGIAVAGLLADIASSTIVAGKNANAGALPFGVGLKHAAGSDDAYDVPSAGADVIAGIAVFAQGGNNIGLASATPANAGVLSGAEFNVLKKGRIYVQVEEAVAPGDPVYCRYASGAGGTQLGAFRKSADTATAALVKGAKYESTAAINGYAVVSYDSNAAGT